MRWITISRCSSRLLEHFFLTPLPYKPPRQSRRGCVLPRPTPLATSPLASETLRERGARYVVDAQGQPFAVLLTLEEYERCLDLLDDEADSQDPELAARLDEAAARTGDERLAFRDYLCQRGASDADKV
jgi:PHD/YefM family antitoxin component YafN of YafNO toxin-antitoxin module